MLIGVTPDIALAVLHHAGVDLAPPPSRSQTSPEPRRSAAPPVVRPPSSAPPHWRGAGARHEDALEAFMGQQTRRRR